jgi:nicotinate phosphoribosyltransferase
MSIFTGKRLTQAQLGLDIAGLRTGIYTDQYFENIVRILSGLSAAGARYTGTPSRDLHVDTHTLEIGDVIVEAQVFNRRAPYALVGGVDATLEMLRSATGVMQSGEFVSTADQLEVLAVEDGTLTHYQGDPMHVQPILKIRGRYRDFAMLETPILGILTRISRIATNVYRVLQVANGKPVLFFPARFDLPQVQATDGYAYWLAVQRYNLDTGHTLRPAVSTDAQGKWWDGSGGGTIPHALIACFLGDSVAAILAFAEHIPVDTPRILLADFNNDTTRDSRQVAYAFWQRYREALLSGDEIAQKRWTLNGVRLDTSANMRDLALAESDGKGVSPALVYAVRHALDTAYETWGETGAMRDAAQQFCQEVQIVVTGGFDHDRIARFEREGVPVDVYGVGSTFLQNDHETNTDYTMDIVRVQIAGQWVDVAKVGRQVGENSLLHPVNLGAASHG